MIYVIVPAFNEAENLQSLIPALAESCKATSEEYGIWIINDGSRDTTGQIAGFLATRYPVRVFHHETNLGVGAVFRTAIHAVCKIARENDVMIVIEGDNSCDPRLIPGMVAKIRDGADVVIASRHSGGGGYRGFPLKRLILSYGANFLLRLLFPISGARDFTIFYRGYCARTLQAAVREYREKFIECGSFVANAEILVKLRALGITVSEIPLLYRYDLKKGKSKLPVAATLNEYVSFIICNVGRAG
ncbi:MAG: glycosyltransferase [Candidatus Binatia bacterium]